MTVRSVARVLVGGLAALLLAWFGRWHEPGQASSMLAGSGRGMGGPTGVGRAAPPRFAPRSEQPPIEQAADRERLRQRLGGWLRGDAPARERALEGFVREAGLDQKSAGRLRELARGASQTAGTLDRLGDRAPLPAAALLDDTEAVLRWILSEDQWALFCERVLDQQT